MINKYIKKSIIVEAVQWTGTTESLKEIMMFLCLKTLKIRDGVLIIKTLEGDMKASKGDWIIKGIKGEFYPCKDEIFKKTYDKVKT